MTAKIINGKEIAADILIKLEKETKKLKGKPGLAIILVGDNPASEIYVRSKLKKAENAGFYCEKHSLKSDVTQDTLLKVIDELNQNKKIHGMIVQLPLPNHINERLVVDSILPHKDADGLSPINLGNLTNDSNIIVPATAKACINLIKSSGINLQGKHAVVIGRSKLVGKSVSLLLLQENATVTICHSKTINLKKHTLDADILIVAAGKANLITKNMIKEGAIIIDVGTNKVNEKLVGDVDFENVKEVAGFISPVPGGVGPMTIAMLLQNTLQAKDLQEKL